MTPAACFTFLAAVAVSFEAPVTAAVFGALAFWFVGQGG
ncbi:hypothetical protein ACVME8_003545 [Bradyrhizobium diazoefficiens]